MSQGPNPLRDWLLYLGWWLFYLALLASTVLFVVALLIWRQWILASVFAAITVLWVRRVLIESNLAALIRSRFAKPS